MSTQSIDTTTSTLSVAGLGDVPLTITRIRPLNCDGGPLLLLHGGGGPATVAPWGERLAQELGREVIVPVHPGFDGTERPVRVASVADVARVELTLLESLDLTDVTVIGSSVGGWVGLQIALAASSRVVRLVLIDSVGIVVEDHPVADFFSMTPAEMSARTFHDPVRYGINLSTLPEPVRQRMAGNRAPLSQYAGTAMADPHLKGRLAAVVLPALVVWGASDRVVDLDYGQALAAALPGAQLQVVQEAGHLPHVEQPSAVTALVREFVDVS